MLAQSSILSLQGLFLRECMQAQLAVGRDMEAKTTFQQLINLALPQQEMDLLLAAFSAEDKMKII